tara:strand:- start:62 stop:292 length:231 start_codon:yes stop_codon:yes gene_type:complete
MKTIRIGNEIKRVSDSEAEERVKNQGYEYCPKNLWKTSVRNVAPKAPKVTQEDSSKPKKKGKKLSRSEKRELKNAS